MSEGDVLLEVRDLCVVYESLDARIRAVDHVDLTLRRGETLALVGESGCGKSTLGNAIIGILPANAEVSGEILFEGVNIVSLPRKRMRRIRWEKIAMVFQNAQNSLDPTLRVGDQLVEVILAHRSIPRVEAQRRVKELFSLVGLPPDYYRSYPHELSGGSRQRVIIAMALLLNPQLLIADEPTTGLDVSVQLQILNLLKDIKQRFQMSMIFITHDIAVANYVSDRMAVMYAGQIVEAAPSQALLAKPLHPYTIALTESLLTLDRRVKKQPIAGFPPDLSKTITGCRFAERCRFAVDECRREEPPMVDVDGRVSKCFFAEQISNKVVGYDYRGD
jgi:oligopeptide/dipeptide ABC transporter ATP-binding protein